MSDGTRALFSRRTVVGAAVAAGALFPRPAGAQQSILWYSASASGADEEWSKMFKTKTGVGVEYFRIGGVKLTERIEQEVRARQVRFSVMDISIPGLMSLWSRKGMLAQYDSPAGTRLAGYWTPINTLTLSWPTMPTTSARRTRPGPGRICSSRSGRAG